MSNGHIAAPITVKIEGKDYLLSPITMSDLKELERYVQDEAIEGVKKHVEGLPLEVGARLIEKAYEEKLKRQIGTSAFNQAVASLSGSIYLLWLSIRKKHKDVTLDKASELLTAENTKEIVGKLHQVAGFTAEDDSDPFVQATPEN